MPIRRTSFRSVEAPASATDGQYRRLLRMRVCVCVCVAGWCTVAMFGHCMLRAAAGRTTTPAGGQWPHQ